MIERQADLADAEALTDLWLRARRAAVPAIPAPVHPDDGVRWWMREVVLAEQEAWVLEDASGIVALLVLDGPWLEQLYVDPALLGEGLGAQLLDSAKLRRPGGLELKTFASNVRAQAFYRRHGFEELETSDGTNNEEGAPDVHYRWLPAAAIA